MISTITLLHTNDQTYARITNQHGESYTLAINAALAQWLEDNETAE